MKYQEYSKHWEQEINLANQKENRRIKGGFKGDWIVGLTLMAILVIVICS